MKVNLTSCVSKCYFEIWKMDLDIKNIRVKSVCPRSRVYFVIGKLDKTSFTYLGHIFYQF